MGATADAPLDRAAQRRRAAAPLARHYRDEEGLSIAQIADRLRRSPATVKAYFYDPSDANKRPTSSRTGKVRELGITCASRFSALGLAVQRVR
ncbi:MAG: response regulator transcription factor [Solirubrobacterales bacterium]|nr:response regulator transcription factor [Solirubrobacterales bacterium]